LTQPASAATKSKRVTVSAGTSGTVATVRIAGPAGVRRTEKRTPSKQDICQAAGKKIEKRFRFLLTETANSASLLTMKTQINLHVALTQCRIARRQGKISSEIQQRILRRLCNANNLDIEPITHNRWGRMMALRASIEREIAPQKEAFRRTQWESICTAKQLLATELKSEPALAETVIPPIDPRFDYVWWKEQERLESEQKARELKAAYAR
jgi:hypothetical protein